MKSPQFSVGAAALMSPQGISSKATNSSFADRKLNQSVLLLLLLFSSFGGGGGGMLLVVSPGVCSGDGLIRRITSESLFLGAVKCDGMF